VSASLLKKELRVNDNIKAIAMAAAMRSLRGVARVKNVPIKEADIEKHVGLVFGPDADGDDSVEFVPLTDLGQLLIDTMNADWDRRGMPYERFAPSQKERGKQQRRPDMKQPVARGAQPARGRTIKPTDKVAIRTRPDEAAGEYELQVVHLDSGDIVYRRRVPFGTVTARQIERFLASYKGPDDIGALCEHLQAGLQ
jgi:hypothetical protein